MFPGWAWVQQAGELGSARMASSTHSFITHSFVYSSAHVFSKCVLSSISEPDLERPGRGRCTHALSERMFCWGDGQRAREQMKNETVACCRECREHRGAETGCPSAVLSVPVLSACEKWPVPPSPAEMHGWH